MPTGRRRLMVNNYTFHKSDHTAANMIRWRCSARGRGCKCFVMVDETENVIIRMTGVHTHAPPNLINVQDDVYVMLKV